MFNTTVINPVRVEHVPYEKAVTINRAPTDASIKLWEEMRDKAYASLLESITISDNGMNGRAIVMRDLYTDKVKFKYEFTLNGRSYGGSGDFTDYDIKGRRELAEKIYNSLAGAIAVELLSKAEVFKNL